MKKISFFLSMTLLAAMIGNIAVYADTSYTIDTTTINGSPAGIRQVEIKDIIITEPTAGLFEKDKVIYLKCDHLIFEDGATAEVVKGDIRIKEIEAEEDILKITIEKASSEAAEIKISNIQLYLDGSLANGKYDLDLITEESEAYPNNAFGGFYEQNTQKGDFATSSIAIIENFVTISTTPRDKQQTSVINTRSVSVAVSEYTDSENAYVSQGHIMVPLRAIIEELSDKAIVRWDDTTKTVTIGIGKRTGSMTVGSNILNLNGVGTPMTVSPEIKEGRVFVPVEDLAYLLGIHESKIQWNPDTNTLTLR
ncbi:MAG TPA: hypothetical protein IAB62_01860 [Candidatus Coprocola pullicola]|nr:hypothetical protein [Candidatus Coprocola pullicola]